MRVQIEKKIINLSARISIFRNDLNQLIQTSAIGAATISRVRWVRFGKKKSKYFLGLEKRNGDKKSVKYPYKMPMDP